MRVLDRAEHQVLAPLDAVRRWLLARTSGISTRFVRDRDKRVIAGALIAATLGLVGTALGPGYMLLLGPVILGVPHLFFEARYLFLQHADLRRTSLVAIVIAQTALAFHGVGIYTLGIATLTALALTGAWRTRRGKLIAACAALAQLAALVGPDWSRFVLLHAHNCMPIVVWVLWRERRTRVSIAVASCFVVGVALIAVGCFDALPIRHPFADDVFSITKINDAVAAGFGGAWRHRFLLLFCFTQAFHYAVWVRLIPEEARERATPRSWRASWDAFKRDSGAVVARLTVVLSLAVPCAAIVVGAVRTRALYVTASEFHATVEVILAAVVVARMMPACSKSPASPETIRTG